MSIWCPSRCSAVRPCRICEFLNLCSQKCTHFRRKFDARIRDETISPYRYQSRRDSELQDKHLQTEWDSKKQFASKTLPLLRGARGKRLARRDTHPIWTRHIPMHWSSSSAVPLCSDASLLLLSSTREKSTKTMIKTVIHAISQFYRLSKWPTRKKNWRKIVYSVREKERQK